MADVIYQRRTNDVLGNRLPLFAFVFAIAFAFIFYSPAASARTKFRIVSTVLFPDFRRQFDLSVAHASGSYLSLNPSFHCVHGPVLFSHRNRPRPHASGSYLSLNPRFHCVPGPVLFSNRNRPWPRFGPQRHILYAAKNKAFRNV